jgi:copper transport protein
VRWAVFLSVMAALGLFVFRCLIARPLAALTAGRSLRAVTVALGVALAAGLLLVPVYAVLTTAEFSTLSPLDLGALAPLVRISSFGRALTDLWVVLALFALCAGIAVWLDRPARPQRSTVALAALGSALATGAALLVIPGLAGHPAQTSPAALALALDWVHLAAGSVWLGGLCGLMVLWIALPRGARGGALGAVVPRFSRVALVSVLAIIATGTAAALLHLPTLPSLWQTSYGLALLVKVVLLALAMLLGAYNMLVTTPRLETGARSRNAALGESGAVLLRRTVTLEIPLVAGALLAAAVLTSLPPPASALGKVGNALARVGPGPVTKTLRQGGYTMVVRVDPNRAALPNTFSLRLSRNGRPVTGATVIARFDMLDMDMSTLSYTMPETAPGLYERSAPALVMVGHWGLTYEVTPRAGAPLRFVVVDKASG